MKINSTNEWDRLRAVVVGTAKNANWPTTCPDFREMEKTTAWPYTPVPAGPVEPWIIEQAEQDLAQLCNIFVQHGVEVYRPDEYNYQKHDAFHGYCPRDRLLILGDKIVIPNMMVSVRDQEIDTYSFLTKFDHVYVDDKEAKFDAANICRLGKDLLYLVSSSGNARGADWLQSNFPEYTVHKIEGLYQGSHIDSTICALNDHTVVLNADRITYDNMPEVIKDWDHIWIGKDDLEPMGFYKYPYASSWLAVNMVSIDPRTVIADPTQTKVVAKLRQKGYNVITTPMTHCRTLGGGFHCCTLDLWREHGD